MSARKHPSVRSMLARTSVQPPYAVPPTRAELFALLESVAGGRDMASEARQVLQRDEDHRTWVDRQQALRTAINSHYKVTSRSQVAGFNVAQAKPCDCPSCGRWRAEQRAMHDDKASKEPKA